VSTAFVDPAHQRSGAGGALYRFLRSIPTWVLWLLVVIWMIPTFGLFVNSFRGKDAQRNSGWWTVFTGNFDQIGLQNYKAVLSNTVNGSMSQALANSLAIALPATIIPIGIAACAAYAFAWIDFKGREILFIATVSMLAIPTQVSLIPLSLMYGKGAHYTVPFFDKTITVMPNLHLQGETTAVWLSHAAFAMPFAIFLLHNYISSLPRDLFEAARIDGADHFKIFWRLVLPLSVPVLAAFAIFQFLWTWNDYLVAVVMVGSNSRAWPSTVNIAQQAGTFTDNEHLLTAGAFLQAIVPVSVFFLLQRFFVRGILAGSVKG
jgi:alpha-glucoside transport system permease protein